jgi:hypothetical protein
MGTAVESQTLQATAVPEMHLETDPGPGMITHYIDPDRGMVFVSCAGRLDFGVCARAIRALADDPGFSPRYKILADVREVDFHPDSAEAIDLARTIVDMREFFAGKIALVVAGRVQLFTAQLVSRLAMAGGITMMPFRDMEEALRF